VSRTGRTLESSISTLLRTCLVVSSVAIATGLAGEVARTRAGAGASVAGPGGSVVATFRSAPVAARTAGPAPVLARVAALDPGAFIDVGLLVLMFTPILRVATALLLFVVAGEAPMAAICGTVLLLLAAGLAVVPA
jgi:uncharacterized membrane protein